MVYVLFLLTYLFTWTSKAAALAHHSQSIGIENLPHEILHFCATNKKRFFVTTTMDDDNDQVATRYIYNRITQ
jgi:hypothetical protein